MRILRGCYRKVIAQEGQVLLGWRDIPVDPEGLGVSVKPTEPVMRQVFVGIGDNCADQDAFERKLFVARKQIENEIHTSDKEDAKHFYFSSFSSRLLLYKGMLLSDQVGQYYHDLNDERMVSAIALVHQRFAM